MIKKYFFHSIFLNLFFFKEVFAAVLKFLGGDEYYFDFFITLILLRSNSFKTNLSVFNLLPNLELEFDPIPKA